MNNENDYYLEIGKHIIKNLNKLISGEHKGIFVEVPFRLENSAAIFTCSISMPRMMDRTIDNDGNFKFNHYTWVPEEKCYILSDHIYKVKKKVKTDEAL